MRSNAGLRSSTVALSTRAWRPLLDGKLAEKARADIAEIDAALREPVSDPSPRTLELYQPGSGVGGYRAWRMDRETKQFDWDNDTTFLTGACGIGLSLLAATSTLDPAWDRLLAASLA
jgi:hypothetical protein